MTELTIVKGNATATPGQQLVWKAIAVATSAWVGAGDALTDAHDGEDVDLVAALESTYARLGMAIEELQAISEKLDNLFQAADDVISTIPGAK